MSMVRNGGGDLKKGLIVICILLALLTSWGGCVITTDFYAGKRPYDYGEAIWVSEAPDAWFAVAPREDAYSIYPEGELSIDNKIIKFVISFGYSQNACFTDENNNIILVGTCKYSPEKLVIIVDKKRSPCLNDQYESITFVRCASAETMDNKRKLRGII